jgi:hypothetical protein
MSHCICLMYHQMIPFSCSCTLQPKKLEDRQLNASFSLPTSHPAPTRGWISNNSHRARVVFEWKRPAKVGSRYGTSRDHYDHIKDVRGQKVETRRQNKLHSVKFYRDCPFEIYSINHTALLSLSDSRINDLQPESDRNSKKAFRI